MAKCSKCGGNRTPEKCNLCELFASATSGLGQSPAGWPRSSLSMGVHPTQVAEATEHARKMGIPTEFTPGGEPIMTSPGHQKRYAKEICGFVDCGRRVNTSRVEDCRG